MYDDDEEAQVDVTKLRYVLYARKSTDDPQRQVRSRGDQIAECKQLAKRIGLRIVATIEEDRSARMPHNRPQFDIMMKGLAAKKYDAIISWSPDRIARNMVEGSDVLNMVDSGIIQDIKFVTHYFTNNASGKMLLGISFVMADYYSKNLSENVSRGVKRSLKEGKSSGTPKHGYVRGEDKRYHPDGDNFDLIRKAWEMRKAGKSLESIATYMNDNGYARTYKENAEKAGQTVKMTDKILSDRVFPDPFYYGILLQKGKQVDLRLIPGYDFQPATDEQTYDYIQSLTGRRSAVKRATRAVFKPLVDMVFCAYCNKKMYPQTPLSGRKDEKTKILSYRCDTEYCPRKNKELKLTQSVRAKVIFNFMYEMLRGFTVTRNDYEQLQKRLVTANTAVVQRNAMKLHSKQGALKNIDRDIKERSLKIIKHDPESTIYKTNETYIAGLEVEREKVQDDITKLEQLQTNPTEDVMSFEKFLNVANNASKLLKVADIAAKDRIARLIYLNVTVDDQKVVDYQIREPFKTYFQMHKILAGRHSHILLELFKYITENPEPSELLLEQLRATRPSKPQLVEGLVF